MYFKSLKRYWVWSVLCIFSLSCTGEGLPDGKYYISWRTASDTIGGQQLRIENCAKVEGTDKWTFDVVLQKDGAFKDGFLGGASYGIIEDGVIKFSVRYPNLIDDQCLRYLVFENKMTKSKYPQIVGLWNGVMSSDAPAPGLNPSGTKIAMTLRAKETMKTDSP